MSAVKLLKSLKEVWESRKWMRVVVPWRQARYA